MATDVTVNEVFGVVECSNPRGLKLAGESAWRNVSKWASIDAMPGKGDCVTLGLDRSGYVRTVTTDTAPQAGNISGLAEPAAMPACSGPADRQTVITRLACLNTATAILQCGGNVPAIAEILEAAAVLEGWANR